MAKKYGIRPRANGELPPPGLLLSLGDGSAVQVTEDMMLNALDDVLVDIGKDTYIDPRKIIAALIQQAQEARDAG